MSINLCMCKVYTNIYPFALNVNVIVSPKNPQRIKLINRQEMLGVDYFVLFCLQGTAKTQLI